MENENKYIKTWCIELRNAWIAKDFEAITALFSQTTSYFEDPFTAPGTTLTEIIHFWDEIAFQDIQSLIIEPLLSNGLTAAIHWYLEYNDTRDSSKFVMDGVYIVEFNSDHKCVSFKQWWVIKE